MTSVGLALVNAMFPRPELGLQGVRTAATIEWVNVIAVVEAKNLPASLGLDPVEWLVVRREQTAATRGVAFAVRRPAFGLNPTASARALNPVWRQTARASHANLARWSLTITVGGRRLRVVHMVPKRAGRRAWLAQARRAFPGRWVAIAADFNAKPGRARRGFGRLGRLTQSGVVGIAVKPWVPVGRVEIKQVKGLDHRIVAVELLPGGRLLRLQSRAGQK